ncbi:T9SS type A sorting domain-containing protein [Pedobacter nutrimenti]|uniref:T9SS type A sorting domain-containing protein n=1 Tax=Pedobacter nutrimenti TaxID=1241337 RepID=UPI00292D37CA|nr:T9SS type A sorting domain-containing protein [Pedobacter nutrimenti]
MRKVLLFVLNIAFISNMHAQQSGRPETEPGDNYHRNYILEVLQQQWATSNTMQKPTGTKQRVIAQTSKGTTFKDSCTYSYSNNRGSAFNYNMFSYNTILNNVYAPNFVYLKTMNPLDVLADTITNYDRDTIRYKDYGVYRPDNKLSLILTDYADDYPFNRNKSVMTYNNDNLPDVYYYSMYNIPGPADTNSKVKYSYSAGKVMVDSFWAKEGGAWNFAGYQEHYYNPGNKLIADSNFFVNASTVQVAYVTLFTYYPDGKLSTMNTTYFNNDTIWYTDRDSLGYTAGADYATYWENRRTAPTTGTLTISREIKYPGAAGVPDSAKVWRITNSGQQLRTFRYQYNSYGNPERISVFNDGNNTPTPNQTYTFYYELYDNGLAINETDPINDFKIYPNPFDNYLSINFKTQQTGYYSLKIISLAGREVCSQTSKVQSEAIKISLPDLSDGIYLIEVQAPNGNFIRKKIVRK